MIEAQTIQEAKTLNTPETVLEEAMQQLGVNLASAISLGSLETVNVEMEWVRGLLHEHNQDSHSLENFIKMYATSITEVMGANGQTISSWLKAQVNGSKK